MTHDDLERLRARLKSPAPNTVLTAGDLRFEHIGGDYWNGDADGLYEPLTGTLAEWERLAELILGVTREEVAALLAPPPEPVWWPTSPGWWWMRNQWGETAPVYVVESLRVFSRYEPNPDEEGWAKPAGPYRAPDGWEHGAEYCRAPSGLSFVPMVTPPRLAHRPGMVRLRRMSTTQRWTWATFFALAAMMFGVGWSALERDGVLVVGAVLVACLFARSAVDEGRLRALEREAKRSEELRHALLRGDYGNVAAKGEGAER